MRNLRDTLMIILLISFRKILDTAHSTRFVSTSRRFCWFTRSEIYNYCRYRVLVWIINVYRAGRVQTYITNNIIFRQPVEVDIEYTYIRPRAVCSDNKRVLLLKDRHSRANLRAFICASAGRFIITLAYISTLMSTIVSGLFFSNLWVIDVFCTPLLAFGALLF